MCNTLYLTKKVSIAVLTTVFTLILHTVTYAQYSTTVDTLNCNGGTTTFIVDLSSNADSSWISPPQLRAGDCCGTDNNCVQFVVTLAPNASGINFTIPSGCGAVPSGSLFYQVDCGPLTSVGAPICLDGQGPFIITFCKPGNNENCYAIESIAEPTVSENVITADACSDTMGVSGVIGTSVSWNSIYPGLPGDYNDLLSDLSGSTSGVNGVPFTGFDTVIVTPGINAPAEIKYEVCAESSTNCTTENWCDTITVFIYPELDAKITPDEPALCIGGNPLTLNANPIGGTAPYSYEWTTLVDPTINGLTTQSINVTMPGIYAVSIKDGTNCPSGTDTVVVTDYSMGISVNAGIDFSICATPLPTVNINGSSPITGSAIWGNYTGNLSGSANDMNNTYTPSASEIAAGFVELSLISLNNMGCPADTDYVQINLTSFSTDVSVLIDSISCFGYSDGAISLNIIGEASPYTYMWSTNDTTANISNLNAQDYSVDIEDSYGCTSSISFSLENPEELLITDTLVSNYNGYNVSCFGMNDGSIDITITGGSPSYTYNWTTANGSGLVQNSEDQSGLTAGTYEVQVTDVNGCSISETYTLNEPTPLTSIISTSTYPSGDNISCNGYNNGAIDITVNGGSPIYSYNWSTNNGAGVVAAIEDQNNITAGTYNVLVTDINGCTIDTSITLIEPDPIVQSYTTSQYPSGDNIPCFNTNLGAIDLTITGGSPGYSYNWASIDGSGLVFTDEDQNNLTAGTYEVLVIDANGCSITNTIVLTEPDPLQINQTSSIYPSGDNISCFGMNDGSIDITVTGGSPSYTYNWTTTNGSGLVQNSEDQSGLTAGNYKVQITDVNGCSISETYTLNEPTPLTSIISTSTYPSGDNISCNGYNDGAIDLTVNGGSPIYSYNWNTNNGAGVVAVGEDQNNLIAGTYNVLVTDINGCTIDTSITLIEPDPIVQSYTTSQYPSGDNIPCFNTNLGAIDLTITGGSPGYSYNWASIDGSGLVFTDEDQVNLTAGTYEVLVIDANGCSITNTIVLTEPDPLQINQTSSIYPSGDNISCFGMNDGSIDITVTGGSPSYTYNWTTTDGSGLVQSSEDQSGLTAGIYYVIVNDTNGCKISVMITLTEPDELTQSASISTFPSGSNISCFGLNDGNIDLSVSGGSPGYTYNWNSNNGAGVVAVDEDQNNLTAGTYNVLVTDINGCTIDTSIILIEPEALELFGSIGVYPSGNNISCSGANDGSIDITIQGGSPGYTYNWSSTDGNGLIISDEDQLNLSGGTYVVSVLDTNGCAIDSSFTLIEPDPIEVEITALTDYYGAPVSCIGANDGEIIASANGGNPGYTYSWNTVPIQYTASISNLEEGTYEVVVTDTNGCNGVSQITISANPLPQIQEPEPITACLGETVTFGIPNDENQCEWNLSNGMVINNCGPNSIYFDEAGCYDLLYIVTNEFMCSDSMEISNFICVNPGPTAEFTFNPSSPSTVNNEVYFYNESQNAIEYEWDFSDGYFTSEENPTHSFSPDQAGSYYVTLYAYDENGCLDTVTQVIEVIDEMLFYVPNTFTPDGDEHNATFRPVFGTGYDPADYRLVIYNRWGETVFESYNMSIGWDGTYNGNYAQEGTYVWAMEVKSSEYTDTPGAKSVYNGHVNLLR